MEHCHIYEPAFSREMLSICKPSYIEYSMNVLPKKLVDESKNAHSKIIYIQTAQQKSWVQQGPFEVNQKIPRTRDGIFSNIRQRHVSENSNVRIEVFNNGGK